MDPIICPRCGSDEYELHDENMSTVEHLVVTFECLDCGRRQYLDLLEDGTAVPYSPWREAMFDGFWAIARRVIGWLPGWAK